MSNFKISYEDIKKLLGVFYNSPYQISAPYVDMLHNLQDENTSTFLACFENEKAALTAAQNPIAEPVEVKME